MNLIFLSNSKCAFVDREDWEWLRQWNWSYDTTTGYAYRRLHLPSSRKNQKCKKIYMHRLLNDTPEGMVTDHINRNKLDNRRHNLRSATHSQNHINRSKQSNNTSGFKGVSWSNKENRWVVSLVAQGKIRFRKSFKTLDDAIDARQKAGELYHNV